MLLLGASTSGCHTSDKCDYEIHHQATVIAAMERDALEAIDVTKKDLHAARGARAVPFSRRQRDIEPEVDRPVGQRAARRLELRQNDFDPAAGGHGWTEHCPKCDRARSYGWRSAIQMQHSEACRTRIELALGQTHRGRERLEHTKLRFDRRRAAPAAAQRTTGASWRRGGDERRRQRW